MSLDLLQHTPCTDTPQQRCIAPAVRPTRRPFWGSSLFGGRGTVYVTVVESVYQRDDLIKRANGNLSHKTPRSQTGSLRVEGSDKGETYT